VWSDGCNFLYLSSAKRWALCTSRRSVFEDDACLLSRLPAFGRYPHSVYAWEHSDGRPCEATITCHGHLQTQRLDVTSTAATLPFSNSEGRSVHRPEPQRSTNAFESRHPSQFLKVDCPEKTDLDGYYWLLSFLFNDCPCWTDGQNYIYRTVDRSWAVCVDLESMDENLGWLFSAMETGDETHPQDVISWRYYTGVEWCSSSGRIRSSFTPFLFLEWPGRPEAEGTYSLEKAAYRGRPSWRNGCHYLYMSECGSWVFSTGLDSIAADTFWLRSVCSQSEIRLPQSVTRWYCCQDQHWQPCNAQVVPSRRPPPAMLRVRCPEVPDINGAYELLEKLHNGSPIWGCAEKRLYMTSSSSWAIGLGEDNVAMDIGRLYSSFAGADKRLPDNVRLWHYFVDGQWLPSSASIMPAPPQWLSVVCPGSLDMQGVYKLLDWENNGQPVWANGSNLIFMSTRKEWLFGSGIQCLETENGRLHSHRVDAERKYPCDISEWEDVHGILADARIDEIGAPPLATSAATEEVWY